jgi:uroporphyrinogen decarboxylase
MMTQEAFLHEDFLDYFHADARLARRIDKEQSGQTKIVDAGDCTCYTDEWGVGWRMPKEEGHYYDMYKSPFDTDDWRERLKTYTWPDPAALWRFAGLRERALEAHKKNKISVVNSISPALSFHYAFLRGYERFFMDFVAEPGTVEYFLDKLTDIKIAYWDCVLSEVGEHLDIANEADDVAGQRGLFFSPDIYRRIVKPRQKKIFSFIKKKTPRVKILMHSCGCVREVISDFIEIGVEILNPVQISARNMDPFELKREFGKDITFWGGGIDTQNVLSKGTKQEVIDDVRRNIEALAPGGGFVFTPVHNIQSEVPPENYITMWETLMRYGYYGR